MNDSQRIDWLDARTERLRDIYWRIENEGSTVREAIDWLAEKQAEDSDGSVAVKS